MSRNKVVRTPVNRQIPVIMSEMQTAADTLQEIGWGVSVFGSARIKPDSPYYAMGEALGTKLAQAGLPAEVRALWRPPIKGLTRRAGKASA